MHLLCVSLDGFGIHSILMRAVFTTCSLLCPSLGHSVTYKALGPRGVGWTAFHVVQIGLAIPPESSTCTSASYSNE